MTSKSGNRYSPELNHYPPATVLVYPEVFYLRVPLSIPNITDTPDLLIFSCLYPK